MFSKIAELLGRKPEFIIKTLTKEELRGDELERILNGKISGIIVKKFFDPEKEIKIDFDAFAKRETPFGFTTGLSIFNSKDDLSDYFAENDAYNRLINTTLQSIDYQQNLESVFSRIFNNREVKVYNNKPRENYKLSTLRVIEPNKEGIQKHIGNEFMFNFVQTEAVRNDTINKTQFSFFSVLQAPEKGGELVLFEKYWKNTPKEIVEPGSLIHKRIERSHFLKDIDSLPLSLEKGDLLVFDGGRIWHKVNSVKGNKERITVGGFLAISKNQKNIYYWS